jgi:DNA-binding response OmpR family regulator
MQILILSFEPSIMHILQMVLEAEDYTVVVTRSATEAVRIIEDSSDSFVLFTDNYHVNEEGQRAFTLLRDRPELRHRVWIVGMTAMRDDSASIVAGLMDEHLPMPFTYEQLRCIVEAHDSHESDTSS